SPDFINTLLTLEASVGDLKASTSRREAILKKDTEHTNSGNTLALAGLYIDDKKYDEASKLLDLVRASDKRPAVQMIVTLTEGRLYAEQKQIDKVLAAFDEHIKRQDPKTLTPQVFIDLGRFLIDRKEYPKGIEMIQRGEQYQNPKVMEADRAVAEILVEI